MTPFVEESLKYLTERVNLSGLHSNDEDAIKVTLRVIKKQREILNPKEIETWAIANKWQAKPVKDLVSWVTAISSGGRVQLKFKEMAPSEKDVLNRIKERLNEDA